MSEFALEATPPPVAPPLMADEPQAPRALPTSVLWGMWQAIGLVVFVVASNITASLAASYVRESPAAPVVRSLGVGAIFAGAYLAQIGLVALAARRAGSQLSPAVALGRAPHGWSWLAWTAAAVVAARFVGVWVVAMLHFSGVRLPEPILNPLRSFGENPVGLASAIIILLIIAPLTEEIVFRGVVLPAFADRWGVVAGVLVSALSFSAVHLQPLVMLVVFPAGIAFAVVAIRYRSLWPSVVAHSLFNAISLAALFGLFGGGRS